jgi:hypothetical protein
MQFRIGRTVAVALVLVAGGCSTAGGASGSDSRSAQERLEEAVMLRFTRVIEAQHLPYVVTQSEFQDNWFVIQIDDPLKRANATSAVTELMMFGPLRMYRDAVTPLMGRMSDVDMFILSFRDGDQTVFEIEPDELRRYIDGELSDEEMATEVTITALNS